MLGTPRRALLGAGLALATPGLAATQARAQVVQRNARIVIGFPAGGSSDILARPYSERLRGSFAPNVHVEGRFRAAGRTAVEIVKDGLQDGTPQLTTTVSLPGP